MPRRGDGGGFARENGWVEAEEDGSKVGFGSFAGVWLKPLLDADDECRADRGE